MRRNNFQNRPQRAHNNNNNNNQNNNNRDDNNNGENNNRENNMRYYNNNRNNNNNNNNNRDNNNNNINTEARSRISLRRVTELLDKEPDTIVLTLTDKTFGFDEYMSAETMGENLIRLFTQVIDKAFECNSMNSQKLKLVEQLINSNFLKTLLYRSLETTKDRTGNYDMQLTQNSINICNFILKTNPAAMDTIDAFIDRVEVIVKLRIRDPDLTEEYNNKIEKTRTEINERKNQNVQRVQPVKRSNLTFLTQATDEFSEPPVKLTDMPILPQLNEINGTTRPFLRKNIINGAFKSVEHYLDVHFRLLREDFLEPLRKGICEFLSIIRDHRQKNPHVALTVAFQNNEFLKKLAHIEGLRVYNNVKFKANACSDSGVTFSLQLDAEKCKNIKWEYSKRLLYGSLVCLSNDYFENNFILAVICDRDPESLKKGIIKVKIEEGENRIDKDVLLNEKDSYIMFETTAYFEAYQHVLHALKSLNGIQPNDFPFKKYIVDCKNSQMNPPEYLEHSDIDLRTLVDNRKINVLSANFDPSTYYAKSCSIRGVNRWPSPEQMNLDHSQYEAIRLALTNKIALIQGPPGTGKTYIGVKLVKLLLHNRDLWNNEAYSRKRPILMICYTNHALDSFLESCVSECQLRDGVVRIGGRCKNPNLDGFLLRKIKDKVREERKIDKSIFYQTREEQRRLRSLQDDINRYLSMIALCENGILKLGLLFEFMGPECPQKFGTDRNFLEWLGFSVSDNLENSFNQKMQIDENNNDAVNQNTNEFLEEDDNDEETVMDEDDNDERILDDDFVTAKNKKGKNVTEKNILDYIENKNDYIFSEKDILSFFDPNFSSEWKVVGKNNNSVKSLFKRITRNTVAKEIHTHNVWYLPYEDRISLYTHWVNQFKAKYKNMIDGLKQQYDQSSNSLAELRMQEDRMIMQNSYIVAMTTTGSARYHKILQDIGPRIVIVEEAAEVFEAHIVTALSRRCEHLILIGDHVQLKPKPQVYKLEKEYHLDVSLFERLIKNNLNYVTLSCQHRMRPEISVLMKHFYSTEIIDHESVKKRPNIMGVKQNIAFISHIKAEENYDEGKSKINRFEVNYLIQLAKYLLKQHYSGTQITILTMYLGQFFLFREQIRHEKLKDVRVCTVDNYQGEENDIILLSLVRSNKEEKIGFLAIENRICVALSRARNGFYCIGNFNLLNKTSIQYKTKWSAILDMLKEKNCISTGLLLTCGNHPKNDLLAENPKDFEKRPEGGCNSACEFRLDCGHTCSLFCHLYDPEHENIKCTKECMALKHCGHHCKKTCGHKKNCYEYECNEKVLKSLKCGHQTSLLCCQDPINAKCSKKCERILKCGHRCLKLCSVQPCEPCTDNISMTTLCDHKKPVKAPCGTDSWKLQELCNSNCNSELECGHLCKSKCGECYGGRIHSLCTEKCGRVLVCGHECNTPCAKQCPPCTKKCQNRCSHSKCSSLCSMPCTPCREKCDWKCEHKTCTKLCFEICNREPCDKPCPRKLNCKHKHDCIGFCGEPCPPLCRICDKDKVTEIFFGTEDSPDARFVYLEDCKHVVEAEGMTHWLESQYGDKRENDNTDNSSNAIKLPDCPKCKTPIRQNLRYSFYVKRQLFAIEQVKMKYSGTKEEITNSKNEFINYIQSNITKAETQYMDKASDIVKQVSDVKRFSRVDLINLQNKWMLYFKLLGIEKSNRDYIKDEASLKCLEYEIRKIKSILFENNTRSNSSQNIVIHVSSQYQNEISNEIQRLDKLFQYFKCKEYIYSRLGNDHVKPAFSILIQIDFILLNKTSSYDKIKEKLSELFTKIKPYLSGLQINEEERQMILKAMNLQKGHWYKCPNGHVYCITECGGAMQESNCPDCGVRIGGGNHRLTSGNSVATEMDGSRYAAWSEQANMENFDLNDLH